MLIVASFEGIKFGLCKSRLEDKIVNRDSEIMKAYIDFYLAKNVKI